MMKLKDKDIQPSMAGLPASHREWWDLGDGYEIYVSIGPKSCTLGIRAAKNDITLDVARLLGVDTEVGNIDFKPHKKGSDLYLVLGIDCVGLRYTHPENYKELLKRIEMIVNEHFKYQ